MAENGQNNKKDSDLRCVQTSRNAKTNSNAFLNKTTLIVKLRKTSKNIIGGIISIFNHNSGFYTLPHKIRFGSAGHLISVSLS